MDVNLEQTLQKSLIPLRAARMKARQSNLKERLALLKNFESGLNHHQERFLEALHKDFAKPRFESILSEILPLREELHVLRKKLRSWTKPRRVRGSPLFPGSQSFIRHEGKGVVLIIAPWNYPINLALVPLAGALAAGNTVLLKPSELTPHVSKALVDFCQDIFPPELVQVVEGGVEMSQALLKEKFDHIFFTGSTQVGRVVMKAAAENLTPVTLELGGKSPVIVAPGTDLEKTAERIVWGKILNSGQTCIAPDFVFVHEKEIRQLQDALLKKRHEMQPDPREGAQIVTERHAERLRQMDPQTTIHTDSRRLQLSFPLNPSAQSALRQEEIFGPVLPLRSYENLEDVFRDLRQEERPLALYIFARDENTWQQILNETDSGGVCVNDTILHLSNSNLPFGGIGGSGIGNYHGEASLRCFSHERSVFVQGPLGALMRLVAPPYNERKERILNLMAKWM